jgi:hypothetical protein
MNFHDIMAPSATPASATVPYFGPVEPLMEFRSKGCKEPYVCNLRDIYSGKVTPAMVEQHFHGELSVQERDPKNRSDKLWQFNAYWRMRIDGMRVLYSYDGIKITK